MTKRCISMIVALFVSLTCLRVCAAEGKPDFTIQHSWMRKETFRQGTARTRGRLDYPKPGAKFGNLTGIPVLEKLMRYAPIEDIDRCENCAKLFIIAENEELFDNKDHAILAHQRATGIRKLVTVKGIKHYGIYGEKRKEAQQLALAWFDAHLKKSNAVIDQDQEEASPAQSTQ